MVAAQWQRNVADPARSAQVPGGVALLEARMFQVLDPPRPGLHGYVITSALKREEVRQMAEELEHEILRQGKLRVLLELESAPYGEVGALWEDLKFEARHLNDMERVALVGDRGWEKAAARLFDTLTPADCRFFPAGERDAAWDWLAG